MKLQKRIENIIELANSEDSDKETEIIRTCEKILDEHVGVDYFLRFYSSLTLLQEVMFTIKDLENNQCLIANPLSDFPEEYDSVQELLEEQYEKLEKIEKNIS